MTSEEDRAAARQGPASFAQERLWFLDRLTPGTPQYTVWAALHLRGRLDPHALQRAVDAVVERHDALRTTFTGARDAVLATVAPRSAVRVTVERVAAAQDVGELVRAAARRPFDMSVGPLLRVAVWRLADDEHVMLVTAHHIVADAWSLQVLLADLGTAYTAAALGHDPRLPPTAVGSLEVAAWQRERLQGTHLQQLQAFWARYLAGAPLVLELPTDRPRPPILGHRGAVHRWRLPDTLVREVRQLGLEAGATTFTVLLAGFAAVLGRWSRQKELAIGVPMASRTEVELEGLVGYLVDTLPVRVDLQGAPSFAELVGRVQATLLDTIEHQELPFEQLVEALHPDRTLSHTPVFQVVCTMAPDTGAGLRAPGLTSTPMPVDTGTAKFDLTLALEPTDEGLHASLEYRTELFEAATVARLAGHLETLLGAAARNPGRPLPRLPILTAVERRQVAEWAGPATAGAERGCLHELFRAQARRTPTAVAVRHAGRDLTYAELDLQANQLAHGLRALGVGPDALVAVCMDRRPELIVAMLATLKAGGAYLPLDPDWPAQRLAFMLDDARALAVVTSRAVQQRLPTTTRPIVLIDEERQRVAAHGATAPASAVTAGNLAYVIYTSGSSGRPKGVAVIHANVTALLEATDPLLAGGGPDVWTMFHSPAFDFSVWELWGALLHGGRLVMVDQLVSRSPAAFGKLLRDEGVTVLSQTPSALATLEAEELADAAPRLLVLGGEALHPAIVQPWLARHADRCRPVNMYGTTETTVHATALVLTPDNLAAKVTGSRIGRPLGHVYIRILDPWLEPVPVGVPGELCIGGPGLARGYLHRPGLTADRFVPDPDPPSPGARLYRTGDLGRYLPDGQLEFLGRADRQLKLRGFRIEPGEVEATLARHPAVRQAIVTAHQAKASGSPRLVAYLVTSDPARPLDVAEVRRWLHDWLPDHMIPGACVVLEALPRTPSGKLDPRALPPPAPDRAHLDVAYLPPRTPTERRLAAIWRDVLALDQVGIHDDFFNLGGHSLLATSVIARIREDLGVEVGVAAFFTGASTIAELAEQIETLRWATSGGGTSARHADYEEGTL